MKINGVEVERVESWTENGQIVIIVNMADGSYYAKVQSEVEFVFNAEYVPEGC